MSEAFLSRWSKRKQGQPLDDELEAAENQPPAQTPDQASAQEALQETPDKELTDADMPDLESLDDQSDVSMFFAEGVSRALKQKALQKLFHQPGFNTISELDEYAEDYSQVVSLTSATAGKMRSLFKDKLDEWLEEEDQPVADTTQPDNKESDDDAQT
ncbi:DUF3306 domain-containing protein [Marinospirillum sp.]|uniref:DUF3306 domain-containing protein n=1 Tax=Marinospirillum sp. TaxID=2183934 RepID=UPI00384BDA59